MVKSSGWSHQNVSNLFFSWNIRYIHIYLFWTWFNTLCNIFGFLSKWLIIVKGKITVQGFNRNNCCLLIYYFNLKLGWKRLVLDKGQITIIEFPYHFTSYFIYLFYINLSIGSVSVSFFYRNAGCYIKSPNLEDQGLFSLRLAPSHPRPVRFGRPYQ